MKKASSDFSAFEKFKLENLKVIVGGTNDGGIIDPPTKPSNIGGRP